MPMLERHDESGVEERLESLSFEQPTLAMGGLCRSVLNSPLSKLAHNVQNKLSGSIGQRQLPGRNDGTGA
jgi:hypothetical protein